MQVLLPSSDTQNIDGNERNQQFNVWKPWGMLVWVQLVRGVGFDGVVTTRSYRCSGVCGKGWKAWLVGVQLFFLENNGRH